MGAVVGAVVGAAVGWVLGTGAAPGVRSFSLPTSFGMIRTRARIRISRITAAAMVCGRVSVVPKTVTPFGFAGVIGIGRQAGRVEPIGVGPAVAV